MQRFANRLRHAKLKAEIVRRVAEAPRPRRMLVVCHANLCRSPYLEAVLRCNLPDIEIASAGVLGAGRRVPAEGIAAARDRGIDLSGHRSRLLTGEALERADVVIVMEPRQARMLIGAFGVRSDRVIVAGDLDVDADEPRQIVDPWGRSRDVFVETFVRLDRCARELTLMLAADAVNDAVNDAGRPPGATT